MAAMKLSHHDYTVGWVCALPLEMTAAKLMLEEIHELLPQPPTDPNAYTLGKLGEHNVVIACLPSGVYGTTSATAVIAKMHSTFFSLKFALMVGIAGGVPHKSTDVRLGDVVVSMPSGTYGGVVQYDFGKTLPDGRFQRTSSLNKPPQLLLNAVSKVRSEYMITEADIDGTISRILNTNERLRQNFSRPQKDWLFNAEYIHASNHPDCLECDQTQLVRRASRNSSEPHIHYGLVASANRVMRDAKIRDSLAQDLNVFCFEMEAAGLMDQLPCLVIRGICDYCDSHKNKEWQGYAALAAATYSRLLLTVVPSQDNISHRNHALAQQNETLKSRRIAALKKLYVSLYQDQKNRNPDRIPGTCEWFISHPIFQDWESSKTSRMLWVSANPGCGKSVLAKYLADSVLTHGLSRAVGYFFFKDDFDDQKSITNALCCILHQLFDQKRDLLTETILERFEMNERVTSSFSELWNILIKVTSEENTGEIVFLLDALDECEQHGCSQFMEALRTLYKDESQQNFNLKFLITSRPYSHIRQGFQPLNIPGQPVIHLSGESDVETKKISQEIDIFIEAKVNDVQDRLQLTDSERDTLLENLTRVTHRTYLWVYLTLGDLVQNKDYIDERGIVEATSHLPQTVDEAYERILARSTDFQKAKKLLYIVVGALRPVSLKEMNLALALEKGQHSYTNLTLEPENRFQEGIRSICGLFIMIVDSKIYLLHQTAREFLVAREGMVDDINQSSKWRHSLRLQDSHCLLANICIQHLLFTDFEKTPSSAEIGPSRDHSVFLDYSATYWTTHLLESKLQLEDMLPDLNIICDASTKRCQTWLQIYWASLNAKFPTGFTTLMVTSYFGLTPITKHWTETDGIDVDARDHVYGRSALSWAAGNGHIAIVKLLTERSWKRFFQARAFVDLGDKHNRTPLSWAILNGYEEAARVLFMAGSDINLADDIGGTPLYYAILSDRRHLLELFTRERTQLESKDDMQKRLLLSAVKKGHEPVVRMLLEQGVDVESRDNEHGRTLLSWASGNGHAAVVKVLLAKDANVQSRDCQYGRTPPSWAAENMHLVVLGLLLDRSGLESKVHVQKFRDIVGAIITLQAPISVDTLASFLGIPMSDILDPLVSLQSLHPVLHLPTDPNALIQFLHLRFRYFLLHTKTALRVEKNEMHKIIADRCLYIMNSLLKENICGLPSNASEFKDIKDQIVHQCLPKHLQYSCYHWAYHLVQSNELASDEVISFLEQHFLHWLEAISNLEISEFLHDARRLILRNMACSAPLQIYYSAIAFAAEKSIMKTIQLTPIRGITMLPGTTNSWDTRLQTVEGHSDKVRTVAFSPDGQIRASGSHDQTIQLRDAKSGKGLILESYLRKVTTVAFSPDGQILALGSFDGNILLRDIESGKYFHTLQCHLSPVITMVFSPDSQMLASGSGDKTVRLLNTKSGSQRQIFKDHSGWVSTVAFSPDGQILASASRDGTVRLWDTNSGKQLQILQCHLSPVITMVFSPDSQMLAAGSLGRTVQLWDTKSGKRLQTLVGHTRWVSTVAFSPDGQMLASGSHDGTVQLWDTKSGKQLQALKGYSI
ncbi:WD-repeat protein [Aspergillus bombycis]|uniref:WD-repeat protein n=1 Tax=Aspergillus bombycis TaxID=109264 RepID=A0A1F7ZV31_9EURO|nr:WD-repeat protein [Aspergillus bombycis]OGM43267.1 WD-repeat protein [Aspergillus bombycis]